MKRDKILNLPAGRDMDVLIAKKVMGWKKLDKRTFWEDFASTNWNMAGSWTGRPPGYPSDKLAEVPQYSRNITWAWKVRDAMEARGHTFALEDGCIPEWSAAFYLKGDPLVWVHCAADEAPLAICRAALLAMLEE